MVPKTRRPIATFKPSFTSLPELVRLTALGALTISYFLFYHLFFFFALLSCIYKGKSFLIVFTQNVTFTRFSQITKISLWYLSSNNIDLVGTGSLCHTIFFTKNNWPFFFQINQINFLCFFFQRFITKY